MEKTKFEVQTQLYKSNILSFFFFFSLFPFPFSLPQTGWLFFFVLTGLVHIPNPVVSWRF